MTEHIADRADGQQTVDWMAEARRFVKAGIPVFPIKIRFDAAKQKWSKTPLTGNGFIDASTDIDRFDWSKANGFGARMGDGVFMVDVDDQDPNGKPMNWLKERGLDILPTRKHRTVSGGEHWFYKLPDTHRNLPGGQKIARDIDTRGDGGFAAFGEGYQVIDRTSAAELPTPVCEELQARWNQKNLGLSANKPTRPWSKPEGADETLDELLLKDPDLKHRFEGGADVLDDTSRSGFDLSIARRLAMHGCTYDFTVWAILEKAAITTGDERQVMRCALKVENAGKDDFEKIEGAEAVASSRVSEDDDDEDIFGGTPSAAASDEAAGDDGPEDDLSMLPFPDDIVQKGSLLDQIVTWVRGRAWKETTEARPVYMALQLAMVLTQNRFCAINSPLSAYLLQIAPSGAGKGDSEDRMHDITDALNVRSCLRQLPASDAAVVAGLEATRNKHLFYSVDEFGLKLADAAKNVNSRTGGIITTWMLMFGKGVGGRVGEKDYADTGKNIPPIDNPSVNICGWSTWDAFEGVLTTKDVATGFLPRFIFVREDQEKAKFNKNQNLNPTVPQAIVDALGSIARLVEFGTVNTPYANWPVIYRRGSPFLDIPLTPKAKVLRDEYVDQIDSLDEQLEIALANRAVQIATALAGTLALLDWATSPTGCAEVSEQNMRDGVRLAEWSRVNLYRTVGGSVADNQVQRDMLKVERVLKRAKTGLVKSKQPRISKWKAELKKGWVPREVLGKVSRLTADEYRKAIQTLHLHGSIKSLKRNASKDGSVPETEFYRWVD